MLKLGGQGQLESWTSGQDQQPALWAGRGRYPVVGRQTGLMGRQMVLWLQAVQVAEQESPIRRLA